jgi:hypothetical protein
VKRVWIDLYERARDEARLTGKPLKQVALTYGLCPGMEDACVAFLDLLTPAAKAMIRQSVLDAKPSPNDPRPFKFDDWMAISLLKLRGLNLSPATTLDLVERAVKKIIADQMNTTDVGNFVEWIEAGKPPEDYRCVWPVRRGKSPNFEKLSMKAFRPEDFGRKPGEELN